MSCMIDRIRPMPKFDKKQIDRLWNKVAVDESDKCWEWKSYRSRGYGKVNILGSVYFAHRIICYLVHGPHPPDKIAACHSCDNRGCCNPHHLFWGSYEDNTQDAIKKGRKWAAGINPKQQLGERNPNCKLTKKKAALIRRAIGSQRKIAEMFGISQAHVSRIKAMIERREG